MAYYRFGILCGDGIGLEVVPIAASVIDAACEKYPDIKIDWKELPVGYSAFQKYGNSLPQSTVEALKDLDGWILGPIGHMDYPDDPNCVNPHPILRRQFDLVSNIRPARAYDGIPSINPQTDLVIVRENNEGFQPDRNMFAGNSDCMPSPDMALSLRVITRRNSTLAAKTAFELARQRGRLKKVTAIHKNTVYKYGCSLFLEACNEVAKQYPDIEFDTCVVDTFAMKVILDPTNYDVVVTTNMFGDILSDQVAGLVGGLGMAPGLCLGPSYCMGQSTHGSAPDIAGKNKANPFAMIMSAQMMFSWLANKKSDKQAIEAAADIEKVMLEILKSQEDTTPDIGGSGTTTSMGKEICRRLKSI